MEKMEYELVQAFERREYTHTDGLPLLTNYICRNINSDYSANRGYYNVSKLAIVCFRKSWLLFALGNKKHGLPTVSCKGEAICNDELVNLFKDKQHKNCGCLTV